MIQEVKKKIHFQSFVPKQGRTKDENPSPTVYLDRKNARMRFGHKTLDALHMSNKFVAFYYEPTRKIIGWRIKDRLEDGQTVGKNSKWKYVKPFGRGAADGKGFWVVQIKGILESFNGSLKSDTYKNLEVKKYIETDGIIDKGDVYYFVEVKDKYDALGNLMPEEKDETEVVEPEV